MFDQRGNMSFIGKNTESLILKPDIMHPGYYRIFNQKSNKLERTINFMKNHKVKWQKFYHTNGKLKRVIKHQNMLQIEYNHRGEIITNFNQMNQNLIQTDIE